MARIAKKEKRFEEITLVLESQLELDILFTLLEASIDNSDTSERTSDTMIDLYDILSHENTRIGDSLVEVVEGIKLEDI